MASLTRGYSFGSTEQVTNSKLHTLIEGGTVSSIVDADVSSSAAITLSKINITAASINYDRLNLTGSIVNADIKSSAAIADSKLATISTAGKVSGAALTSCSSTPSGAGQFPIANLATGTPDGTKFVRDDGALAVPASINTSNLAFQYQAAVAAASSDLGEGTNASLTATTLTGIFRYLAATETTSLTTVLTGKYKKLSSFSTVTVYCQLWLTLASDAARGHFDIGGQSVNIDSGAVNSPTWYSGTIDVSSLTNGTVYDLTIQLAKASDSITCKPRMGSIFMFNS